MPNTKTSKAPYTLATVAFALSLAGAIISMVSFLVLTSILIWWCVDYANIINWISTDPDIHLNGMSPKEFWDIACIIFIVFICLEAATIAINWIGFGFAQVSRHKNKTYLAPAIVQLFAIPFGTAAGILIIVAHAKQSQKQNK